jgi:oligopeptide transport system permease protein
LIRTVFHRLFGFILTLLVIATVSFFLLRAAPGGPFDADRDVDPTIRAAQERKFGLDRSLPVQYLAYMRDLLLKADLGPSSQYPGMSVNEIIAASLPPSLVLGGLALLIAMGLGIPVGALAGARSGGLQDRAISALAAVGVSVPNFVLGALLLFVFGLSLRLLPVAGWSGPASWVLPALTLGLPMAAVVARLTRTGMIEMMEHDCIRTARAKGMPERRVVMIHALRTSLLPVVSYLGPAAAAVLTGSVVVEQIFAVPGLGTHFVNSALNRDYSLVMGTVLLYSALLIFLNLVSDLLLAALDPRIEVAS